MAPVAHMLLILTAVLALLVLPCSGQPLRKLKSCRKGCRNKMCRANKRKNGCTVTQAVFDPSERFGGQRVDSPDSSLDLAEYFDIPPEEDLSDEVMIGGDVLDPDELETDDFADKAQMNIFLCTSQTYDEYYGEQGLEVPEVEPRNVLIDMLAFELFLEVDTITNDRRGNPGGIPLDSIDMTRVITVPVNRDVLAQASQEEQQETIELAEEEAMPDALSSTACVGECVGTFDKCGGKGTNGVSACCNEDDQCVMKNTFFSQCRPISKPVPTGWSGVVDCNGGHGDGVAAGAYGSVQLCRTLRYNPDLDSSDYHDVDDVPTIDGTGQSMGDPSSQDARPPPPMDPPRREREDRPIDPPRGDREEREDRPVDPPRTRD